MKTKLTECERLQIIYEALEHSKWTVKDLVGLFKDYNQNISETRIQKDLENLSKIVKIQKTKTRLAKYSRQSDEYKELFESIERAKNLNDFRTLNHLRTLERIQINEIRNYTIILIKELLIFDYRANDISHEWASYILAESTAESLREILGYSQSIESLINDTRFYSVALKQAEFKLGIQKNELPNKNPYDLLTIINKKLHPIFIFKNQYLNWRAKNEK